MWINIVERRAVGQVGELTERLETWRCEVGCQIRYWFEARFPLFRVSDLGDLCSNKLVCLID